MKPPRVLFDCKVCGFCFTREGLAVHECKPKTAGKGASRKDKPKPVQLTLGL